MNIQPKQLTHKLAIGIFSLSLSLGALPLAAQNPQPPSDNNNSVNAQNLPGYPTDQTNTQSNGQAGAPQNGEPVGPPPNQAPDQAPPPQAQAPPPPSGAPPEQPGNQPANSFPNLRSPYDQQGAAGQSFAQPAVPPALTIPSGTVLSVRPSDFLSSERNHVGDTFVATLDQPIVANGWVVARKGQTVLGRVNNVKKAGHFGSVSQLGIELTTLNLVDGEQITVQTTLLKSYGGSTTGTDIAAVGVTSGVGAAIGAAAGGGQGAGIGAGAGAVAGLAGVLVSHGKPTVVTPETLLGFQLASQITVNTEHSAVAFHPVTQADYRGDQDAYGPDNRPRLNGRPGGPPPPYYAYPGPYYLGYPYYGYGWDYPGPAIGLGFGWGYGWGGGFRGGFRR